MLHRAVVKTGRVRRAKAQSAQCTIADCLVSFRAASTRLVAWHSAWLRCANKVTLRRARLVVGWVTVIGQVGYISVRNQSDRGQRDKRRTTLGSRTTKEENRNVTSQLGQLTLHPSGVAKSSTSCGWGKGGNVTSG